MIDFVRGKLALKTPTRVVVEVNGVGFDLQISLNTFQNLSEEQSEVQLNTYLHVREDILQLYGFADQKERSIFKELISVSGVGPKLAQTILSGIQPSELLQAIQESDLNRLTSISGVGSKTAQRLVIELKAKFVQMGLVPESSAMHELPELSTIEEEALMALMSLGYKKPIVAKALAKVRKTGSPDSVEEIIKQALQQI
jgi:Holliday junction DNA helicase RuvA